MLSEPPPSGHEVPDFGGCNYIYDTVPQVEDSALKDAWKYVMYVSTIWIPFRKDFQEKRSVVECTN